MGAGVGSQFQLSWEWEREEETPNCSAEEASPGLAAAPTLPRAYWLRRRGERVPLTRCQSGLGSWLDAAGFGLTAADCRLCVRQEEARGRKIHGLWLSGPAFLCILWRMAPGILPPVLLESPVTPSPALWPWDVRVRVGVTPSPAFYPSRRSSCGKVAFLPPALSLFDDLRISSAWFRARH